MSVVHRCIIEFLSEPTYEADSDLVRGKGYSYACGGIREYLALDPTGAFLPERYAPFVRL